MTALNVKNRTLFIADNLDILRGINSETIDLIYLDPPFNTNKKFKAPIGSPAEGAEFKDIWTDEDVKHEWYGEIAQQHQELYQIIQASEFTYNKSMRIYLTAMAIRLFEMKRILKSTGSIYLHCDPTASHYLKLVMDSLFGTKNFQTEITWQRTSAHNDRVFGNVSDIILFYGDKAKDCPNNRLPLDPDYVKKHYRHKDAKGTWRSHDLTGPKTSLGESGKPWRGFDPAHYGGRHWSVPKRGAYAQYIHDVLAPGYLEIQGVHERLDFLDEHKLIHYPSNAGFPGIKRYLMPGQGKIPTSVWIDIPPLTKSAKENTGYPTQKPVALLERIIKASSNEGDMVLDPFCGCATACVAAEQLNRQWVGIDISPDAEDITKLRLIQEADEAKGGGANYLKEKQKGQVMLLDPLTDVHVRRDAPRRTDNAEEVATQQKLPQYQTHKPQLFGKQQGKCNACQHPFHYRNLTVDHIVPQSKAGGDNIENLQLLCQACNSAKGQGTHEQLIQKLKADSIIATD